MNRPASEPVGLELTNIRREFGNNAGLHSTSVRINPGEFVSLLGPSGCGKSTMLRCIAGLETPDEGIVRFGDHEVFNSSKRINKPPNRRGLSMVFQDLALWPHMTVAANVEFPLTTGKQKFSAAERSRLVLEALQKVGISDKADSRPNQLSGGQQQRVAIARAIVSNPKVLLMDEPLSALDAALRVQIRSELTALARDLGLTVVYVTHDQAEALAMSDRVIVMEAGNVRQFATPVEIYDHPADPFVQNFIGTVNTLPDGTSVRPERVELDPYAMLQGTVIDVQYIGGAFEIYCDVEQAPRPWLVRTRQALEIGQTIGLRINSSTPSTRKKNIYAQQ